MRKSATTWLIQVLAAIGLVLTWAVEASGQNPPYLVKDINTTVITSQLGSFPQDLCTVGTTLYFTADDGTHGKELWKCDGTLAGTVIVKDIIPGTSSSNPNSLTPVGATLYFVADDGTHGRELWRSDGTAAGTLMVKDINPGANSSFASYSDSDLTAMGSTLYFSADDGAHGCELWQSDGTAGGTLIVKDTIPGASGSWPSYLTVTGSTLYFCASSAKNWRALWKSDGTNSGTALVKDIDTQGPFTIIGTMLYFSAYDWNGCELWKSDGTDAGTVIVKDINLGSGDSNPTSLAAVNSTLYFAADDGAHGIELWKSDGTDNNTQMVSDIYLGPDGSFPRSLIAGGSILYFVADDGDQYGTELWRSDGTDGGTWVIKNIFSDGGMYPKHLTTVGAVLYFAADEGVHGVELWRSDGTADGTVLVKDIYPGWDGSFPDWLVPVGSTLYFRATGPGTYQQVELWKSDGTAAGTVMVKDINPGATDSSVESLTGMDSMLYFSAFEEATGTELWKSDGTVAGTVIVKDIKPGASGSSPSNLTAVGSTLYFTADDGPHGRELWKSYGTGAATVLVKDILSGANSSAPSNLTAAGSVLYFTADDGTHGAELWKSDGTEAGTSEVKDIRPGTSGSSASNLTAAGSVLYFTADDGTHGRELWKSDGTGAGTLLVKDIQLGASSSSPSKLTAVGSALYFAANDVTHGIELWKSDGTAAGTVMVKDINPGTGYSSPWYLMAVDSTLYFSADDRHGRELWKSDGTDVGTVLVKDINANMVGMCESSPEYLVDLDRHLCFAANDGVRGNELWMSDGTDAGTQCVGDINPGGGNSDPEFLTVIGDMIYFTATEGGSRGRELWAYSTARIKVGDEIAIPADASMSQTTFPSPYVVAISQQGLSRAYAADVTGVTSIVWKDSSGDIIQTDVFGIGNPSSSDCLRLYHTHESFGAGAGLTLAPKVDLNGAEVLVHYNTQIQSKPKDLTLTPPRQRDESDVQLETDQGTGHTVLTAYRDATGCVLLEFDKVPRLLSDGVTLNPSWSPSDFLGVQALQVLSDQFPQNGAVAVDIGSRLSPVVAASQPQTPHVRKGSNDDDGFVYQHLPQSPAAVQHGELYAIKKTGASVSAVEVFWRKESDRLADLNPYDIAWPYEFDQYVFDWPSDPSKFQVYVRDDVGGGRPLGPKVVTPSTLGGDTLQTKVMPYPPQTEPDSYAVPHLDGGLFYTEKASGNPKWTLLRYLVSNGVKGVMFVAVRSVQHNDASIFTNYSTETPCDIGEELSDTSHEPTDISGYIHRLSDQTAGPAREDRYDGLAYDVGDGTSIPQEESLKGQIIPVNKGKLEVWWYNKGKAGVEWPSTVKRYSAGWNTSNEIVIASQAGTGAIDKTKYGSKGTGWNLYWQNKRDLPGFNPNDEHAIVMDALPVIISGKIEGLALAALCKLTLTSVQASVQGKEDSVTINGIVFTAHASQTDVTKHQFSIAGDDAADAAQLVLCINDATYGVSDVLAEVKSNVVRLGAKQAGVRISAKSSKYTIAVDYAQEELPKVVMRGFPGDPETNFFGEYAVEVDYGWSGTVTPTLSGYQFSGAPTVYTNVVKPATQNYTAVPGTTYSISGKVMLNGIGVKDVVMQGLPGKPRSNDRGEYAALVPEGWTGTVTPALVGYVFTPDKTEYVNVTFDQNKDYDVKTVAKSLYGLGFAQNGSPFGDLFDLPGAYGVKEETPQAIFPLRSDLGTDVNPSYDTSEPYVLMRYKTNDNIHAYEVYHVVAEKAPDYIFHYDRLAGKLLEPPYPVRAYGTFPYCGGANETHYASGPGWQDRTGRHWAKAAGASSLTPTADVVMRYFYRIPKGQGFYFPDSGEVPDDASEDSRKKPWLDRYPASPTHLGTPTDLTFKISWPNVNTMRYCDTLVKAKEGLPSIAGQDSVEIIYEQATARDPQKRSAMLIDYKKERVVDLAVADLPDDIKLEDQAGLKYFTDLPPGLKERVCFDPINGKLKFKGMYVEPPAGEYYVLLNVMTAAENDILSGNTEPPLTQAGSSTNYGKAVQKLYGLAATPDEVLDSRRDFVGLALTTGGLPTGYTQDTGYVTLAMLNGAGLAPLPVTLEIIRVEEDLKPGQIAVIKPECPFDERVCLKHKGDFAGKPEEYNFEWYYTKDKNGTPPTDRPVDRNQRNGWSLGSSDTQSTVIEGKGELTLTDNWFICRYARKANPGVWSAWTDAQLAEGWVKRVIGDIDPFTQRATGGGIEGAEERFSVYNKKLVNTVVSMISQAGERFDGVVPLSCTNIDDFGLIEIYETVLKKAMDLSIGTSGMQADFTYTDESVNKALLLAAGRISDLYVLLGNEAYADAADPTIGFGNLNGYEGHFQGEATSIHCFMNRTSSLLEEELVLLHGRDNRNEPLITTTPYYNRFDWNFTHDGTNGGEVAYALNYNIKDAGNVDGRIDEADAKKLYPQGHGDAWGHYLTAMTRYYKLLKHPFFTWKPRAEAVLVGGVPVTVDYFDERRFAVAAAAKAQTGAETVNLEYRNSYKEDPAQQYQGYPDTEVTDRYWGVSDWGSRAGMGAYFDWTVGNAILPAVHMVGEYTPNADYEGPDSITFKVNDGKLDSTNVTVTFDVGHHGNMVPVAFSRTVRMRASDGTRSITLQGMDGDGDTLTYSIQSGPQHGTLSGTAPNVAYAPAAGYVGLDSFTFKVNDGQVDSSDATVTIAVGTYDSNAPIGNPQMVRTEKNRSVTVKLSASDADMDQLTYTVLLVPAHGTMKWQSGVQKIDRTTVREFRDVGSAYQEIQSEVDKADAGLNPLGLAKNAIPFDITPEAVINPLDPKTHFEQIYERTVNALVDAATVFDYANACTQALRSQADSLSDFQQTVVDREMDYKNRLIEIFGYPYSADIGGGKTYPQGYDGPDLYHFDLADPSELMGVDAGTIQTFTVQLRDIRFSDEIDEYGTLNGRTIPVTYYVSSNGFGLVKPASWGNSKRRAPGEIQQARSDLLQARAQFEMALEGYKAYIETVESQAKLLKAQYDANADEIRILETAANRQASLDFEIAMSRSREMGWRTMANQAVILSSAIAEAFPTVVGSGTSVMWDPTSVIRSAIRLMGGEIAGMFSMSADAESLAQLDAQQAKERVQSGTNIQLTDLRGRLGIQQQLDQLAAAIRQEAQLRLQVYSTQESLQQTAGRYFATLARGQRLIEERTRFRQQTAAKIQEFRYKDMAFRIFRNEKLQQYRAQFDLAARYVYLAANAYDYETCLMPTDGRGPGQAFLQDIVRARAIGKLTGGRPDDGREPSLAKSLFAMSKSFVELKTSMGFNAPRIETTRFSLRSQLFRIRNTKAEDKLWADTLKDYVVRDVLDVPEFKRYCKPWDPVQSPEPAIVIPFSTNINAYLNFFGWPNGGDPSFNSSLFATKIYKVGVWFVDYDDDLRPTPNVYLVPVGNDVMRSPTKLSDNSYTSRTWKIVDQRLPNPAIFISSVLDSQPGWLPFVDSFKQNPSNPNSTFEVFAEIRQMPSFRAYDEDNSQGVPEAEMIDNTRLIGRSVWNTRWLLIIPAVELLPSDRPGGLNTFIYGPSGNGKGVSDILICFKTYSYTGNKGNDQNP